MVSLDLVRLSLFFLWLLLSYFLQFQPFSIQISIKKKKSTVKKLFSSGNTFSEWSWKKNFWETPENFREEFQDLLVYLFLTENENSTHKNYRSSLIISTHLTVPYFSFHSILVFFHWSNKSASFIFLSQKEIHHFALC